jgi:hypothetical protein
MKMHRLQTYKAHTNDINNLYLNINCAGLKYFVDIIRAFSTIHINAIMRSLLFPYSNAEHVTSQERKRSCIMYVEDINLASVFMIFISDFGIVPAVRYLLFFILFLLVHT